MPRNKMAINALADVLSIASMTGVANAVQVEAVSGLIWVLSPHNTDLTPPTFN